MGFLSKKQKETIHEFVKLVKEDLGIEKMPRMFILNGRGDLKTTASYDYTKKVKVIKINGRKRALVDILRSLGHELTHHKQYEEGRIKDSVKDGESGSSIENEANAKAGYYVRIFCKKNPNIYDLEEQIEPPSMETDTTTTTGTEKKGYPEVGKWESGVTRGAGNQIGITKWSDVVGSTLIRGKANKLK